MSSSEPNAHVISGQAFAPGTSHAHPAQLHLNASRTLVWIVTHDDGRINERHQLKRIDLEPQLGRLEARITFPDGWLFITNDTTVFDRLGSDRFSQNTARKDTDQTRAEGFDLVTEVGKAI